MSNEIDAKDFGSQDFEKALGRLRKLAEESATFADFRARLVSFKRWYLGDPVVPEFRTWTWADYEKIFNEVKGIK